MTTAEGGLSERPAGAGARPTSAILAWWGGFLFGGPLAPALIYLSSRNDPLARAHGKAGAIAWSIAMVVWAPLSAWVILLGGADPLVLLAALPVIFLPLLAACVVGSARAKRGQSFSGRQIVSSSVGSASNAAR